MTSPEEEDLKAPADGCDLLIIPTTPGALALDALMLTVKALDDFRATRYRILVSIIDRAGMVKKLVQPSRKQGCRFLPGIQFCIFQRLPEI
jgi:cellulose biosynthesis protein BcsQ